MRARHAVELSGGRLLLERPAVRHDFHVPGPHEGELEVVGVDVEVRGGSPVAGVVVRQVPAVRIGRVRDQHARAVGEVRLDLEERVAKRRGIENAQLLILARILERQRPLGRVALGILVRVADAHLQDVVLVVGLKLKDRVVVGEADEAPAGRQTEIAGPLL